ncbi:hypothetical protein BLD44_009935 [Mastigocladus laminosus UU774]|nr:hypothetical protein BLD44_009935 [Mastigocladus laminosus UU774]
MILSEALYGSVHKPHIFSKKTCRCL